MALDIARAIRRPPSPCQDSHRLAVMLQPFHAHPAKMAMVVVRKASTTSSCSGVRRPSFCAMPMMVSAALLSPVERLGERLLEHGLQGWHLFLTRRLRGP